LKKAFLIGSLLLAAVFLLAQGHEKIRVIHSDKLQLTKMQDEQVMKLEGRVHFWYGKTEFKADRALIFDLQKIARLDGNVKVSNDSLSIAADSLTYYRKVEQLNAGGRVLIEEKKKGTVMRWFRADKAVYDQLHNSVTVWENVSSHDREENADITCGYAFWDRKTRYSYLVEEPLIHIAGKDTLTVRADKFEYFQTERKLMATFNVLVQTGEFEASSDFLVYLMNEDKAMFIGQPEFRSDKAIASAGEFYLYFQDRVLQTAELIDSCRLDFTENEDQHRQNWVTADYIRVAFEDRQIRGFEAEKSVEYSYLREKSEDRDYFLNTAAGENLEASFSDKSELETMKMRSRIKGVYKFHKDS